MRDQANEAIETVKLDEAIERARKAVDDCTLGEIGCNQCGRPMNPVARMLRSHVRLVLPRESQESRGSLIGFSPVRVCTLGVEYSGGVV